MPGIYVHKTGWLDWSQKGENSILAVPGSYWLCHRSTIYKFIFRYHRIIRSVKQFSFGKELMRVVRRVIKHQPHQGQQFCTEHLLITYNRTTWTRQDKVFALIKFKQRSVTVFSHAFVLTIKVCCSLENIDQNIKYVVATSHTDKCLISHIEKSNIEQPHESKNGKKIKELAHSLKNDGSEKECHCANSQEKILESQNRRIQLDDNIFKELVKQTISDNTNEFLKIPKISLKLSMKDNISAETNTKVHVKVKENKSSKNNMIKLQKENENEGIPNIRSVLLNNNTCRLSNFICLEEKSNAKSLNRCKKLPRLHKHDIDKESIDCKISLASNNSETLNNNIVGNNNLDSTNLPYQYLIEKEIEDTKHKVSDLKSSLPEIENTDKLCNQYEHNSKKHRLEDVYENVKDLNSLKRKRHVIENVTSRSSDITDLVMEGLMFTIQQGQDAVAVIEQKTKLEVDEVLENSEKIETKEGEKRLRNSSLLGLENLITMIDLPRQIESGDKWSNIAIQENTVKNKSPNKYPLNCIQNSLKDINLKENITTNLKYTCTQPSYNSASLANTSFSINTENLHATNKHEYFTTNNDYKFEENMNSEKNKNIYHSKEEIEEDIIPEALQNNVFQTPVHTIKDVHQYDQLFMENRHVLINDEILTNSETVNNKCKSFPTKNLLIKKHLNTYCLNNELMRSEENPLKFIVNKSVKICDNSIKKKISVPKIISNQAITMNEIPLSLQNVLSNRLSTQHISLISDNKTNANNCKDHKEIHNMQQYQEIKTIPNVQSKTELLDSAIDHSDVIKESLLSTLPKVEVTDISTSKKILRPQTEKLEKQNIYNEKAELSSNKMQDITQEFYKDLSYLQDKKMLNNQKYHKSGIKPINMTKTINYEEMQVEMVKLFQDITKGVKVVVTRISTKQCS